ncbi:aminopeptidase N [Thiohalospira sp.]|uniref:aminopeptidase N n=1 Tax=Thiohalospira sp. TaxID=3080549 RepID=UPI00397FD6CC
MREGSPHAPVRLTDYQPPAYLLDTVDLHFQLDPGRTRVRSQLALRPNPAAEEAGAPLVLHGRELELLRLELDGEALTRATYSVDAERLIIPEVPDRPFTLTVETATRPEANTALEGLYTSGGKLCTQCEPEGFRRITYFPDRPDVLACYTVTLEAEREEYPVLLANGNRVAAGEGEEGRHWVRWEDPFPKPSYLFALVAGDLTCCTDRFTTASGREVDLHLYTEAHNADRADHALTSLKQAMRWDEETYGREYDLDLYQIVAVDDFNMGAMENKGLNLFNSQFVLARPDTATDADYANIQAVVGHEYFHNWTGNRITCRDWFQLSLKEGLTVFREQQFSAAMGSEAVARIDSVDRLRGAQFPEDAGPTAHPVRPSEYVEINNFYTPTVYEKGAEVVRMLHNALGPEGFRAGCDRYFERFDGRAVTVEDFITALEEANDRDLRQFRRWYTQAGTPQLEVRSSFDAEAGTFDLCVRQHTPATPDQPHKEPVPIPLAMGLVGADGADLPLQLEGESEAVHGTRVLLLHYEEERFRFTGLTEEPIPSLLRGFSAPVEVDYPYRDAELAHLAGHDGDLFNRWEAGQRLARTHLLAQAEAVGSGGEAVLPDPLRAAFTRLLEAPPADAALAARALMLPDEGQLAEYMETIDPDALHAAREAARTGLARELRDGWWALRDRFRDTGPYRFEPEAVGQRALANTALAYLMAEPDEAARAACMEQFRQADNMTDQLAALRALAAADVPERPEALDAFYERWQDDPLVVDKWLAIQAASPLPGGVERVQALMDHPAFSLTNPNKVRAVIGAFAMRNPAQFHRPDGAGYRLLADVVLELDGRNPQIAARLVKPLTRWRRFVPEREAAMHAELERLRERAGSPDVGEMVDRALGDEGEA